MEHEERGILPQSLLNQLQLDEKTSQDALAFSSPAEATGPVRQQAERILLSSTAPALRKLKTIVESGSDKDAISAATLILQKSPATRDQTIFSGGLSFSPETLAPLLQGLSLFAQIATAGLGSGAGLAPSAQVVQVPEQAEPILAPKRKKK